MYNYNWYDDPNYNMFTDNPYEEDIYLYRPKLNNILFNEIYRYDTKKYDLAEPKPMDKYLHNNIKGKLSNIHMFDNIENFSDREIYNIFSMFDLYIALKNIVLLIKYKYLCDRYDINFNKSDYDSVNKEYLYMMGFIILEKITSKKYLQLTKIKLNKVINKHVTTYILDKYIEKLPMGDGPNISKLIMSYV